MSGKMYTADDMRPLWYTFKQKWPHSINYFVSPFKFNWDMSGKM